MTFLKRFLTSCALFAFAATPVLAQSTVADQAILDCHAKAWQPYRNAVLGTTSAYTNVIRAEWKKQTAASIGSSRTKYIRASRVRAMERGRLTLEKALDAFQANASGAIGQDDRRLAELARLDDEEKRDQSSEAWIQRVPARGNLETMLASLEGVLRRNVNTKDLRGASQSWRSTRQNAWQQLVAETQTLREEYLDNAQACLNDLEAPDTEEPDKSSTEKPADHEEEQTPVKPEPKEMRFDVVSITVGSRSADPKTCNAPFISTGKITVNGAGTIKYTWLRSDAIVSLVETATFAGAGTKEVSLKWLPEKNNGGGYSGWAQLKTLSPNIMASEQSAFSASCDKPKDLPANQPIIQAAEGEVTNVSLSVSPEKSSVCPQSFTFDGGITTNGPTKVTYTWDRSDGAVAPLETIIFHSAGTQKVQSTWWNLGTSHEGWRRLRVVFPSPKQSADAKFSLSCPVVAAPVMQVTNLKVAVDPAEAVSQTCQQAFTMLGSITASAAGKVRYRWERSDGVAYPEETIAFSTAGSKSVSDTWFLGVAIKGWVRLRVLAPNDTESSPAPLSLSCPSAANNPNTEQNANKPAQEEPNLPQPAMSGNVSLEVDPTAPKINQEYTITTKIGPSNLPAERLAAVIMNSNGEALAKCEKTDKCSVTLKSSEPREEKLIATFSDLKYPQSRISSPTFLLVVK